MKPIIIITGSTASGKSGLAVQMAQEFNGIIINIDSMQIYQDVPIITAQPSTQEQQAAPHKLYGTLEAQVICSAGYYLPLAHAEINHAHAIGKLPILVGGTGLYIKSLIYGMAKIPDIDPAIRLEARNLQQQIGSHALYNLLDAEAAQELNPGDSQRVIRAYEVLKQTGISITKWRTNHEPSAYQLKQFLLIGLMPERPSLYQKCDQRFLDMIKSGVIEEIAHLNRITMDETLPVRRAQGVQEITQYLQGRLSLEDATSKAQQITRNYAKRQITWLRHQMQAAQLLDFSGQDIPSKDCKVLINQHLQRF